MGDALNSLIIQAYKEKCDEVEYWKSVALERDNRIDVIMYISNKLRNNVHDLYRILYGTNKLSYNGIVKKECNKDCLYYTNDGFVQKCIDECDKLMTCKDIMTSVKCADCSPHYKVLHCGYLNNKNIKW